MTAGAILIAIFLIIAFFTYLLPTIIAIKRNHDEIIAIFLLNFFLGWLLIGWVGALVWAATSKKVKTEITPQIIEIHHK
jgi:hypothetical protein